MKPSTFTQKIFTSFTATGLVLAATLFTAGCGDEMSSAPAPATPAAEDATPAGSDTADESAAPEGSGTTGSTEPAGGSGTN